MGVALGGNEQTAHQLVQCPIRFESPASIKLLPRGCNEFADAFEKLPGAILAGRKSQKKISAQFAPHRLQNIALYIVEHGLMGGRRFFQQFGTVQVYRHDCLLNEEIRCDKKVSIAQYKPLGQRKKFFSEKMGVSTKMIFL
jgi:hypothetical protein